MGAEIVTNTILEGSFPYNMAQNPILIIKAPILRIQINLGLSSWSYQEHTSTEFLTAPEIRV